MQRASDILYRFRGHILAFFAGALFACPAAPFPQNYSRMVEIGPYLVTIFAYAIGIMLRIKSRQYIGEHTRGKTHEADKLVTDGPYAYCRHPLYMSNTCIALGAIFFHVGVTSFFHIFFLSTLLFEYLLARAEDRFLEEKFGDTWRAWAKDTPMYPSNAEIFVDHCKMGTPRRTVFQAFKADASTWFWFVIVNLIIVLLKIYTI